MRNNSTIIQNEDSILEMHSALEDQEHQNDVGVYYEHFDSQPHDPTDGDIYTCMNSSIKNSKMNFCQIHEK